MTDCENYINATGRCVRLGGLCVHGAKVAGSDAPFFCNFRISRHVGKGEQDNKHNRKGSEMSNELTILTPEGAFVAPNGNEQIASALCDFIHRQKDELVAQIRAVEVTADNYDSAEVKDALQRAKSAIEDLRERGKRLVKDILAATDALRVITQIDSRLWSYSTKADHLCAYAVLDREYKELKAKVDGFKAANTPPAPTHTYVVRVTATDAALGKIVKMAAKEGATDICYAAAQSDKAVKQIAKWFEENA